MYGQQDLFECQVHFHQTRLHYVCMGVLSRDSLRKVGLSTGFGNDISNFDNVRNQYNVQDYEIKLSFRLFVKGYYTIFKQTPRGRRDNVGGPRVTESDGDKRFQRLREWVAFRSREGGRKLYLEWTQGKRVPRRSTDRSIKLIDYVLCQGNRSTQWETPIVNVKFTSKNLTVRPVHRISSSPVYVIKTSSPVIPRLRSDLNDPQNPDHSPSQS